ncbi:hypothetical protein PAALTS15_14811 [Paenibacillus alvei TS-15]|uniref:Uncharacterized protein n=1 Tax=Paenibacillus alvei TS-15 TaxID=1117108 RepID=S9SQP1_PAEAL|nr:hypothetical protein PAALTS15_14811 [Paenibacillus alvei TS-15]
MIERYAVQLVHRDDHGIGSLIIAAAGIEQEQTSAEEQLLQQWQQWRHIDTSYITVTDNRR